MMHRARMALAATMGLTMLLLSGCGQPAGREIQAGPVTVSVPEEWVDSPSEALSDMWTVGADSSVDGATARVRIAPELDSGPYATSALSEVSSRATFEGWYGGTFQQGTESEISVDGADQAQEMQFEFTGAGDGATYTGRFWAVADRSSGKTAVVELTTNTEGGLSEDQIEQIRNSLEFDPSAES
ncbi:MAG: hypothetical protein ACTH0M_01630 [Brevibacterium yomogidense]|uniref:hypothetical protein n=1 Tax=Brevibacterium sp. Mu109 TaxID=1255669 RepID=UPI0011AED243|nr:hypothetical protein [Brevibacterium sp. Mu109]